MRIFQCGLHSAVKNKEIHKVVLFDPVTRIKGHKIPLMPQRGKYVTWYSCGPTVYDSAHIGHATSYIRLDIVRRILERQEYKVLHVMGVTDIDDKIIDRSNYLKVGWEHLSRQYELEFVNQLRQLNVKIPHYRARVSEFIPEIMAFVQRLVTSGHAYPVADGSVYFDIKKYQNAQIFVHPEPDEEFANELHSSRKLKKQAKDFALWKGSKPNEPSWNSPWGEGRPGWHIECSAMASFFFGSSLDIHTGGLDLKFPHHSNEETQCCALFGSERWVQHWIHTGHLIMKDEKMSKSLGNTLTITQFLKEYSPDVLRMICLLQNIRGDISYNTNTLQVATQKLSTFDTFITYCDAILKGSNAVVIDSAADLWEQLNIAENKINTALCDDFDTRQALNILNDFLSAFYKNVNPLNTQQALPGETGGPGAVDFTLLLAAKNLVEDFFHTLGFSQGPSKIPQVKERSEQSQESEQLIQYMLDEFTEFRQSVREYSLALDEPDALKRKHLMTERKQMLEACDSVRRKLAGYGIDVKDRGRTSSWNMRRQISSQK